MKELFQHIERFVTLSDADKEAMTSLLILRDVKKKEMLLKEDKVCTANYFVVKGCLRMYYVNNKGIDHIVQFGLDNWWLTDYVSYSVGKPSQFFIQAIEATEVIVWEKAKEEELFVKVPTLERYFRIILQRSAAASQQRFKYLDDFSGEERYHHFANSFPEFVQRVPQYMLASYLGFTPEFLSKIRAGKV
jgi:CRP/FNR family transcriptional regulator